MKNIKNISLITALILLAALSRVLPHPPNFTPLAALTLLGAAHLHRSVGVAALLIPLAGFWLSDLLLNNVVYAQYYPNFVWASDSFWWSAAAMAIIYMAGSRFLNTFSWKKIAPISLLSAVIFFLVSNFGVWKSSGMYAPTADGLLTCYIAAIPFFGYSLLGDMLYSFVLFGAYAWANKKIGVSSSSLSS
ncbi:MAG: hypothetical protein IPL35_16515 [Sphingobacteriales bacterium]|nr:hypothetical protein [Sphingobacteriales bacterium]